MLQNLSLTGLSLALSAPLTLAQVPSVSPTQEILGYPFPFAGNGAFSATELADVDVDGALDAIILDGQTLVVGYMPASMTAVSTITDYAGQPLVANDFAIIRETNPYQSFGTVASVGPDGLSISMFDPIFQTLQRVHLIAGDLLDAKMVRAAYWDVDAHADLVVLDAAGTQVHVLLGDGTGLFTQTTGFTLSLPAVDILPLDWDAGPALELAVTDAAGLKVYKQGLSVPGFMLASPTGAGQVARLENPTGNDDLAWLASVPGGAQYLSSVSSAQGRFHTVQLTGNPVLTMAAGAYENAPYQDLVFTTDQPDELLLMENTAGTAQFSMLDSSLLDWNGGPGLLGGLNLTPVAFGDLDLDGLTDLFVASGAYADLVIVNHPDKVTLTNGVPTHGFLPGETTICRNDAGHGFLNAQIAIADTSSVHEFQISTWIQDSTTRAMTVASHSTCITSFADAEDSEGNLFVQAELTDDGVVDLLDDATDPPLVHVLVRPLNSLGTLAADPVHATYTFEETDLLASERSSTWTTYDLVAATADCGIATAGATDGGWQGSDRIPPFPANQRPVLTNTCKVPSDTPPSP